MARIFHGEVPTMAHVQQSQAALAASSVDVPLAFAAARMVDPQAFGYLFPTLQGDPANLLPEAADTPEKLKVLGRSMEDPGDRPDPGDATIPAAYTYFGQFVDHDITLEVLPANLPPPQSGSMQALLDPKMTPLPQEVVLNTLRNFRTPTLDMDHLYGLPAPRDPANGAKMKIGTVSTPIDTKTGRPITDVQAYQAPFKRPPGKLDDNDVPREPRVTGNDLHDRAALIGDPRNDENLIVSQLHLAFLKAHNALVDQGRPFEEARKLLRQHYQYLVIHDFLKRVADPTVVDNILQHGNRVYNPLADLFMPLEFSVAAYRFGHTMVRPAYNFNLNFNLRGAPSTPATLFLLFTFTALSGQLGIGQGSDTLPFNWIIEWENIVDTGTGNAFGKARRLDTKLAGHSSDNATLPPTDPTAPSALFRLHNLVGQMEAPPDAARLAVRNLLRGYRLRLPTGQALAAHLGLSALTPAEIEAAANSAAQVAALRAGGFQERTPLWYYIFAEAQHSAQGNHLGPVGSTIVAEVLIGLVRQSEDSFLRIPGWLPSLSGAHPGSFELADLLRFAGVLGGGKPPRTYVVQSGDTLSGIAQKELGNAARWPEIFALNRGVLGDPNLIVPGQALILPDATPLLPTPRFHIVQSGDTLSGIAQKELGNAARSSDIFALNRGVLSDPNLIIPGQVLALPS